MNHKTALKLLLPLLALTVAGCASVPPPDSSASHPANAQAAQGTFPPPVPTLVNGTNLVVQKPITAPASEHPHGHESHEAKPKPEEKK